MPLPIYSGTAGKENAAERWQDRKPGTEKLIKLVPGKKQFRKATRLALANLDDFVTKLENWSAKQKEVKGAAIVGSWARGSARPDSDIDVILITTRPDDLLNKQEWLGEFGTAEKIEREDWGLVQSLRVFYADKQEIEFGITTEQWTSQEEIKHGTGEIILDGIVVVYDPHKLLEKVIDLTKRSKTQSSNRRPC